MAVGAITVAALAAGSAGAVAATGDGGREQEQAVLDDAAKRLDVSPEKLRSALAAAQDARIDEAVEQGEITKAQAAAIKERRAEEGTVVDIGAGHRGHGEPGGPGGPAIMFQDLARALGLSEEELRNRLDDGRSIADIAEANDKSLADVRRELRAAAVARLDDAVKEGELTRAQRDAMVEHLDDHLDRLDQAPGVQFSVRPFHGPRGGDGDAVAGAIIPRHVQ